MEGMPGRDKFIERHGWNHVRFLCSNAPAVEAYETGAVGDGRLHHGHVANVVQFEMAPQKIHAAGRRFECENMSGLADKSRQGQSIESDVGSNIVRNATRPDYAGKGYCVIRLVISQPASVGRPRTGYPARALVDTAQNAHGTVVGDKT